jgi:Fe-S cluster assembly protein SufD
MMKEVTASRYPAEYDAIARTLPGAHLPWLRQRRLDALAQFTAGGFPSPREEEWRYTNVSAIEKKLFSPSVEVVEGAVDKAWLDSYRLHGAWSVVLLNGRFSADLSRLAGLPDTVLVLGMAEALAQHPELIESRFGKAADDGEHGFIAFNTAWFSDGLFVHIPSRQVLEKPLQLLHVTTGADALAATRHLVVSDPMSQAEIVETYIGADCAYLTAAVGEVFVGANAELALYKLQAESEKAYHFGGTYVAAARDARFAHHNYAFGGLLARSDIHADLDHASECMLNGLYVGGKRQHIDNHTRINHLKPLATSRELYKGVLDDRARGVFQGRVIVAEDAQKTDSEMNNRNLLLSNDAEADTKPQLEIYADDVKCGHGVTVGQLDEKSVFYLQSRGVDEETARNMLTFAFANEMVDKIRIRELHDLVLGELLQRFPQQGVEKAWL